MRHVMPSSKVKIPDECSILRSGKMICERYSSECTEKVVCVTCLPVSDRNDTAHDLLQLPC
jgi:hypothetical protein